MSHFLSQNTFLFFTAHYFSPVATHLFLEFSICVQDLSDFISRHWQGQFLRRMNAEKKNQVLKGQYWGFVIF